MIDWSLAPMRPLPRAELIIGAALIEHRHDLSTAE